MEKKKSQYPVTEILMHLDRQRMMLLDLRVQRDEETEKAAELMQRLQGHQAKIQELSEAIAKLRAGIEQAEKTRQEMEAQTPKGIPLAGETPE